MSGRAAHAGLSREEALGTASGGIGAGWLLGFLALVALGGAGFLLAVGPMPERAWMSVWMNFLLWSSLSIAGVVFSAVLQAAKGHWGKNYRRLAEGTGAFLPLSFLVFVSLWFGADLIFPWLGPVEGHVNLAWLDLEGVFWRNGALLLGLYAFALVFMGYSLRADAPLVAERHGGWRRGLVRWLARGWRGDEAEVERCRRVLGRLSPVLILAWVGVSTLVAIDFSMSLIPGFHSMVWGAYYFVGGWLSMLALVCVLAAFYERSYGGEARIWGRWEYHDLGKLTFAFVIFWAYLWFAQYLVIWYGNLPREVQFFIPRSAEAFSFVYWTQMVLIFGLPFVLLLGREPKMRPGWLAFVGCIVLVGFWVERYNLVVPSVWEGPGVPLGWPELLISLGFVGLFGLSYAVYASTFPKLPLREVIAVGDAGHGP